jgi:hypothetical protein
MVLPAAAQTAPAKPSLAACSALALSTIVGQKCASLASDALYMFHLSKNHIFYNNGILLKSGYKGFTKDVETTFQYFNSALRDEGI